MKDEHESPCEVRPFPRSRRILIDVGRASRARHPMVGLVEMDVTLARELIRRRHEASGERISFTAFVASCLAKAVATERDVQAYRDLRDRLVVFEDVDVCVSIEVQMDGRSFPMSHVIRAADRRSVVDVHQELRGVQRDPASSPSARMAGPAKAFVLLPGVVRARMQRSLRRLPHLQKEIEGTVGVSSVGMFGAGGGWGLPFQVHTLDVLVGGIVERPAIVEGRVVPREYVDLTLSFDHDVVDGAPAARFAARLRELLESADGLIVKEGVGLARSA
ncbi:MAG: 2-oxo acid dehydrogenase subunit E2 [Actinomycetota bacterium]